MKLTSLQIAALEYYHRRNNKMLTGMLVRHPQTRVVNAMRKKGLMKGTQLTLEGLQALFFYRPQYQDETPSNVVKMADHDSEKGWDIHRFTETKALATHIQNLVNFYGEEAVQWQVQRITKKVA